MTGVAGRTFARAAAAIAGRNRLGLGVLARMHHDRPIVPRRRGDPGRSIERHRHHESVVVIGVLADQIDAARRAIHARRPAEPVSEVGSQIRGIDHFSSLERPAKIANHFVDL